MHFGLFRVVFPALNSRPEANLDSVFSNRYAQAAPSRERMRFRHLVILALALPYLLR